MRAQGLHFHEFLGLVEAPACHVGASIFASAGHAPLSIVAQSNGDQGILLMSGFIGGEEGLQADDIIAQLTALKAKHKTVTVHLRNLMGGAVTDGSLIYNAFQEAEVDTIAEGIVASFGTVLFAAGKKRSVVRFSKLMIHSGRGGVVGTSEDMRAQADFIDSWNDEMAGVFAGVMGIALDTVKAQYFDGKDHWITPAQAVKMGLATKEITGAIKKAAPTAALSNAAEVFAFYETQLNEEDKSINSEMKNKGAIVAALLNGNASLKISAESSEEVLTEAITAQATELVAVKAELKELKDKAEADLKVKAEKKVDEYIAEGKVTAALKDATVAKLVADFDGMTSILDAVPAHQPITAKLNQGTGGAAVTGAEKFAGMPFSKIVAAEGGSDYLDALMASDKDAYDKLKAAYDELPQ